MRGKRIISAILTGLMLFTILFSCVRTDTLYAQGGSDKIRIGYCQAEKYFEFDYVLYDIALGLSENEDVSGLSLDGLSQDSPSAKVWDALCGLNCPWAEFVKEGYIDYSDPEYTRLEDYELGEYIGKKIDDADLDLVITMGTSGGLMVKNNSYVTYMNFLASDPVGSGIVEDQDYSGSSRGWAHVNVGAFANALSVMEDIFKPTKVGFVYNEDEPEAVFYSGASTVEEFGREQGFTMEVVSVNDYFESTDAAYKRYYDDMLRAHEELAGSGIDLYILTSTLLDVNDLGDVLKPFAREGIPVFSINSSEDVRYGAMASVEMFDYVNVGKFGASTIQMFAQGTPIDELSQRYDTSPFLVLNTDVMHDTGIKLPLELLLSTSKFYR